MSENGTEKTLRERERERERESMGRLGLVVVEYGILESCRKMMAFRLIRHKFHAPRGYEHIWQSILALPRLVFPILELVLEDPWKDWSFGIGKSILMVHTNDVYHKLVEDRSWLANKVLDTCYITRPTHVPFCRVEF